ncbi:hypothetical protein [Fusobacterium ulcerans]|uniref:hypothetical protein n=1 Tax=Fusobacterium ulcerans TaxID=861 RepID=UPI0027B89264|nr:hypothetical protein [Fusobacterium ulcerans]
MRKILRKFEELHRNGKTFEEISENIFLNYSAIKDIDLIYEIKKEISKEFSVNLMHIHLIGSSHTGFSKDFVEKDGKDYDFCIIDSQIFQEFLLKVQINRITSTDLKCFYKNLSEGKLHYHYVDDELKNELYEIFEKIRMKLQIDKEISICFYISEKAFIKKISKFLELKYFGYKSSGKMSIEPLEKLKER